jgi:ribosomal-protein-serine acetyltransferase
MFFHRISPEHSLRQLTINDAEELFSVCDASRAHLRRWLPWLDRTRTPVDTRRFAENAWRQFENNQGFQALILVRGRIAGLVGFHRIDWANRLTSLGYWLAAGYEGRGLMTASCEVIVDHAFAALNLNRIAIACASENIRSRAVPERLGFTHEGRLRDAEWLYDHYVDHEIYAQLQREWQARVVTRLVANPEGRAPARP